jgi:ArsR family transcriptional regulator, arsenate/arsenite/antimonite-responsive transcriptional repressor
MAAVARGTSAGRRRPGNGTLPGLVDAVKALAHPGRLRLLAMLQHGDLCVCQMTAVLELAASTVSAHLRDLRHAGLVTERKHGKWVHYQLVAAGPLAGIVRDTLRLAKADHRLARDAKAVEALRKIPLEAFCGTGLHQRPAGGAPPAPGAARPRPSPSSIRRRP